jgi:AraC family transcriptional regulator of adaptative response / DNA-3-methyladenine glycosylase II
MDLDPERCYRALRARDVRFDGRFFVGVTSTGIYCRPICPSRPPNARNCTFHPSAAAAEAAGFRPCLRCRPELAPGNASIDAGARLAQQAASLIEDGVADGHSVEEIAARLGISDRHLRRIFQTEFGVAPIAYAQTHRMLLAKRLLTDTRLSVTEVALASGFHSVRRFNALFRERYRLKPTDVRQAAAPREIADRFTFELAFRPPFAWRALIDFFAARTIAGVDDVAEDAYRRTLRIAVRGVEHTGWIEVRPVARKHTVRVAVATSFAKALPAVLARTRRVFDLACDPGQVQAALGDLAAANPGLRLPGAFDAFELAVRAVLGQQITVRAARTLAGRFAERFGTPIETPFDGLTRLFPAPATVATLSYGDIASLGIIATRAKTILALAQGFANGTVVLEPGTDAATAIGRLCALPGIGDWTAQYMAMRALAWPDAFPHTDYGVMKALGEKNPRRVLAMAEAWRPWRAYAVMHLWHSLK